ncbi:Rrf2 family transcriptional regulator [Streptomyces iconiensis]|uniref:Rrf2 family transcriptional regulator n=1 Tax=Streptomyces iconiensis TaxID=1384038 RepID=A0ABT7A7A7_9ACTN|nr:Rrf2 family transcriptional regulator [Streptomyces iconiensis]MDJ1137223.1 Rrf2 family transcriptional regulator [Streptomyces iconiensis]
MSSGEPAESTNVNSTCVRRVPGPLRDAGPVRSRPGAHSGSELATAARHITPAQVWRLLQGPAPVLGPHGAAPTCSVGRGVQESLAARQGRRRGRRDRAGAVHRARRPGAGRGIPNRPARGRKQHPIHTTVPMSWDTANGAETWQRTMSPTSDVRSSRADSASCAHCRSRTSAVSSPAWPS